MIAITCTKNLKRFIFVNQPGVDGGDGVGRRDEEKTTRKIQFACAVAMELGTCTPINCVEMLVYLNVVDGDS